MICKHCGKELPDNAKFCNYCGGEITGEKFEENTGESTELRKAKTTQGSFNNGVKSISRKWIIGAVASVAVVACAVIAIVSLGKTGGAATQSSQESKQIAEESKGCWAAVKSTSLDKDGNVLGTKQFENDSIGHRVKATEYDKNGKVSATYTYENYENGIAQEISPDVQYIWNYQPGVTKTVTKYLNDKFNGKYQFEYEYDDSGRIKSFTKEDYLPSKELHSREQHTFSFDGKGNVTSYIVDTYNASGNKTQTVSNTYVYENDIRRNTLKETTYNPGGNTESVLTVEEKLDNRGNVVQKTTYYGETQEHAIYIEKCPKCHEGQAGG